MVLRGILAGACQNTTTHERWVSDLVAYLDGGRMVSDPPVVPGALCEAGHWWSSARVLGAGGGEGKGGRGCTVPCPCCCCSRCLRWPYVGWCACVASCAPMPPVCAPGRPKLLRPIRMFWYAAPFVFSPAHAGTDYVSTHRVLKFDRMCREAMKAMGVPIADATAVTQSMWEGAYDGLHYLRGSNDNWNGHVSNVVQQVCCWQRRASRPAAPTLSVL
jgi:hypothetical protein